MSDDDRLDHRLNDIQRLVYKRQAYSIVGGNPAKVIKKRFNETTINQLLAITWWDWSSEKITAHLDAITHADIDVLAKI